MKNYKYIILNVIYKQILFHIQNKFKIMIIIIINIIDIYDNNIG